VREALVEVGNDHAGPDQLPVPLHDERPRAHDLSRELEPADQLTVGQRDVAPVILEYRRKEPVDALQLSMDVVLSQAPDGDPVAVLDPGRQSCELGAQRLWDLHQIELPPEHVDRLAQSGALHESPVMGRVPGLKDDRSMFVSFDQEAGVLLGRE